MNRSKVQTNKKVLSDELTYNGTVLLIYTIEYPEFRASEYQLCISLVNQYYHSKALELKKFIETELFEMAVEQYETDMQNGYPVRVFEAMFVYKVTYASSCIISLYFDRYLYTGGAHGSTIRYAQTWNLQKCARVRLNKLITCKEGYKAYVFSEIMKQIAKNPELYFEDYPELIVDTFNENSFYCTHKGVVIYYQQYDIAPYASGIREFIIPYTESVLNPEKLCYTV